MTRSADVGAHREQPDHVIRSMVGRVEEELRLLIDREVGARSPAVATPVCHAVLSPGKRIRPILLLAGHHAVGGDWRQATLLSCSVELVHAYSLVHDDLPCMDDDVLRRGSPTLHVRYGVPAAALAGAVLMPLAVRTICRAADGMELPSATVRRLISTLAMASGGQGMVGGQLLDLMAEGKQVSAAELERIHAGKTAALIAASVTMGAIAAGAGDKTVKRLDSFGRQLGLAFQTVDDILDLTGSDVQLGKKSGRDTALRKATYPALFGLAEARRFSRAMADSAERELDGIPGADVLRAIAAYVIERTH